MTGRTVNPRNGRITLREGAERLGVHRETLRRWAKDGLLTYWAVGAGQYMTFDPADIEAFERGARHDRAATS